MRRQNRDIFSIFFNMKVSSVFSLKSPHRGDSKRTHNIPFLYIKKLSQICSYGIFSKRPKNEFEAAVVNEPSVFDSLKFYCTFCTDKNVYGWLPDILHAIL